MTIDIFELEKRVRAIEARNQIVENNKAWETSWTRKILLLIFTYVSIGSYMWAIRVNQPWLNAVIPTLGFLLSTLTLPYVKNWWLSKGKSDE